MPPVESLKRYIAPGALTLAATGGGGLAVANTVNAESLHAPTPITRDIGALPTTEPFKLSPANEAPALAGGDLPQATTAESDPFARQAKYDRTCKYHAVLFPGLAGGKSDYVPNKKNWAVRAWANVDGMKRGTWNFKLRNATRCFNGLVVYSYPDQTPSFPEVKKNSNNTYTYRTTEAYSDLDGIVSAGFYAKPIKK